MCVGGGGIPSPIPSTVKLTWPIPMDGDGGSGRESPNDGMGKEFRDPAHAKDA